jgi:hypothetical protein
MTALVSAIEDVSIKLVTQKQLQAECARQGISKLKTKPELLAKLQAHKAQINGGQKADHRPHYRLSEKDEFAIIGTYITLETPMPSSPFSNPSSSPKNKD